jgi:molybdopterin/thiamine biosynthesis adenylyltransferase
MTDSRRFERNLGFMSESDRDLLVNSTVSIAGAGGDGGMLAVELARMQVGSIRLADPDPFEIENINRQAVCTDDTMGVNKAEAVGAYLKKINPDANIEIYNNGITPENVDEFVKGSTLVIDETEFTLQALGVMLGRAAREKEIPVMTAMNIGFAGIVTTFHPHGKMTLESMLGFSEDTSLDDISANPIKNERWLPYLPSYGDMNVLKKVAKGKPAPSISPGVAMAAGIGSTQAFLNIVGQQNKWPKPIYAPKAKVMDALNGTSKEVTMSRISFYRHLAVIATNNLLQRNPTAAY